jgi:hypothetical protein
MAKTKKEKIIFVETDPNKAFPNDTMYALKRHLNVLVKDLERQWRSPTHLLDVTFKDLKVPKPMCNLKNRWDQYLELIGYAVKALHDSRGLTLESFLQL